MFAYGQTASGKTYSMMGTIEQPGVIPQAIDDVFTYIRKSTTREFLLRMSYLEIYNESIRDLLNPDNVDLKIVHSKARLCAVSQLTEEIITSPRQIMKLISRGENHRQVFSTENNERSSRSHTIFQLIVESRLIGDNQDQGVLSSQLVLTFYIELD